MNNGGLKVCILVEKLSGGGAERSAAILSYMFAGMGHEVHMVSITDDIEYEHAGTLFNLGKFKNKMNGPLNKLKRLYIYQNYLKKQHFDYVLDFRFRQKLIKEKILARFLYTNVNVVYMVRSSNLAYYFPKKKKQSQRLFEKAHAVAVQTEAIKTKIEEKYKLKNIVVIPNALDFDEVNQLKNQVLDVDFKYILAAGGMQNDTKQFDKLIEAYSRTSLPQKGIKLIILGRGQLMESYKAHAVFCGVDEHVIFEGFAMNPFKYYTNCLYFVHCSKFEGFPMVILEALATGTAVIALDCPTGPAEMIADGENGILLPQNDFDALQHAMDTLVQDEAQRKTLAIRATDSVKKYSIEKVAQQWQELFER
ncbi:MAG: hypothetical protein CL868_14720 [Cytophagaceae bacterium]|nr:hypothetical protein [Cytophagaceae bacterium]